MLRLVVDADDAAVLLEVLRHDAHDRIESLTLSQLIVVVQALRRASAGGTGPRGADVSPPLPWLAWLRLVAQPAGPDGPEPSGSPR